MKIEFIVNEIVKMNEKFKIEFLIQCTNVNN